MSESSRTLPCDKYRDGWLSKYFLHFQRYNGAEEPHGDTNDPPLLVALCQLEAFAKRRFDKSTDMYDIVEKTMHEGTRALRKKIAYFVLFDGFFPRRGEMLRFSRLTCRFYLFVYCDRCYHCRLKIIVF